MKAFLLSLLVALLSVPGMAQNYDGKAPQTTVLKIDVKDTESLSPWVFGHNLEHTRAAVNRGISAQMLQNRKFAGMSSRNEGVADHWFGIGGDNAFFAINDHVSYTRHDGLFDMHRSHELQTQNVQNLCAGATVGIGQQGVSLVSGREYEFRTVTRVSVPTTLTVSLTDRDGTVVYASHELSLSPDTDWQEVSFVMASGSDDAHGCVRYTFTEASDVLFGALSMQPNDNFHGMRPDVVANLKEIGPAVLRVRGHVLRAPAVFGRCTPQYILQRITARCQDEERHRRACSAATQRGRDTDPPSAIAGSDVRAGIAVSFQVCRSRQGMM